MFAISSHESDDVALWAATAALLYALVLKTLEKKWVVTSKHGRSPSHPDSALEAQSRVVSILNFSNGQSIALILLFLGNYGLFCNMCQQQVHLPAMGTWSAKWALEGQLWSTWQKSNRLHCMNRQGSKWCKSNFLTSEFGFPLLPMEIQAMLSRPDLQSPPKNN